MSGVIMTMKNPSNALERIEVDRDYSEIIDDIDNNADSEYDFYDKNNIRHIYVFIPNRAFIYYHRQKLDGSEAANVTDWNNNYSSGAGLKIYQKSIVSDASGTAISLSTETTLAALNAKIIVPTVSTGNSSSTPLGIDGVFTGTFVEILNHAHITVLVKADQVSATDGLKIEWSTDGITVHDNDSFTIPVNAAKIFTFGPEARYFRVTYTNGGVAQTSFNLQTILKPFYQKPSTHKLSGGLSNEDDVEIIKAVIAGENAESLGTFINVKTNSSGRLLVASDPPEAPPGTDEIIQVEYGSVASSDDLIYTITSGKTLNIRFLSGGGEASVSGSVVELWYDPSGTGTPLTIIDSVFCNGNSDQHTLADKITGDGTKRIIMRRLRLDGGSKILFGRWIGFEE